MDLPINPPLGPMLAKAVKTMPTGDLLYEPKWDGFRCILFRDGDEVELSSRGSKPLTRYFPELVDAARRELPGRCVIDGEIVIRKGSVLDFDSLSQRIHPAASRIALLAERTPASFVAFDLLAVGDEALLEQPFARRRQLLVETLATARPPFHVTPATGSYDTALRWFEEFEGAGLDGVVAKPLGIGYEPDKRLMFKVKHERTADCVVAGFRWHKSGPIVGSLLLGIYNATGGLQHVGVAAAFTAKRRAELVDELAPYRMTELTGHPWAAWAEQAQAAAPAAADPMVTDPVAGTGPDRMPGAVSRWTGKKDLSWVAVRPELVCEVAYEHMEGDRFRHTARFRRWRTDRTPESCTYEQLEEPVAYDLDQILATGS